MKRILIVNSDADTLNLLKGWLERKEYEVKFTLNEQDVPGIIKGFVPDLLLIDVLQVDVLKELKSLVKSKEIPVIVMTGNTMTGNTVDDSQKFKSLADDIIAKPFEPKLLEKKIQSFLKDTG